MSKKKPDLLDSLTPPDTFLDAARERIRKLKGGYLGKLSTIKELFFKKNGKYIPRPKTNDDPLRSEAMKACSNMQGAMDWLNTGPHGEAAQDAYERDLAMMEDFDDD